MHLITERTIREFYETPGNEDSKDSLVNWAARVKKAKWQSSKEKYEYALCRIEALDNAGMTAKELASRLGVSASRVSEYMHDKSQPSLHVAKLLCETLGLSPADVLSAA